MYQKNDIKIRENKIIYIPTPCGDDLIIGGKEEAEQMIKDLREAIKKL